MNPYLPDNVYATLVAVCNRHPGPVQDSRLLGDILNEVAWTHRAEGFGLSRKDSGTHVDSPVGPIAEDVLQRNTDNHHWDVLQSAGVGYPLQPTQGPSIGVMTDPNRPWVAPVQPATAPPVQPPTQPPVTPPTQPPPSAGWALPPDADLTDVTAQLEDYYRHKLQRPERTTCVDQLGYGRWVGHDYMYTRGNGATHEAALDAMFDNIEDITKVPR